MGSHIRSGEFGQMEKINRQGRTRYIIPICRPKKIMSVTRTHAYACVRSLSKDIHGREPTTGNLQLQVFGFGAGDSLVKTAAPYSNSPGCRRALSLPCIQIDLLLANFFIYKLFCVGCVVRWSETCKSFIHAKIRSLQ